MIIRATTAQSHLESTIIPQLGNQEIMRSLSKWPQDREMARVAHLLALSNLDLYM